MEPHRQDVMQQEVAENVEYVKNVTYRNYLENKALNISIVCV